MHRAKNFTMQRIAATGGLCIFTLLSLVLLPGTAQGQCPEPSYDDVEALLASYISDTLLADEQDLTLVDHALSCLSTAGVRDAYQYATVVVDFEANATALNCSEDSCTGYLHILCNSSTNDWTLSETDELRSLELDDDAPIDIASPRTDCGVCSHDGFYMLPELQTLFDNKTHCYSEFLFIKTY